MTLNPAIPSFRSLPDWRREVLQELWSALVAAGLYWKITAGHDHIEFNSAGWGPLYTVAVHRDATIRFYRWRAEPETYELSHPDVFGLVVRRVQELTSDRQETLA